jgi:hypothetical protein
MTTALDQSNKREIALNAEVDELRGNVSFTAVHPEC